MLCSSEYREKIPFVKAAPIEQEETAKQKKQKGQKKKQKGQGDQVKDMAEHVEKMNVKS